MRTRTTHRPTVQAPGRNTELAARALETLQSAFAVLDASDRVVLANGAARVMGVVKARQVVPGPLTALARQARQTGESSTADLELARGEFEPLAVRAWATPLGADGDIALHVSDISEAHRIDAVRRDFVANVSHELKTPVGALSLLAEAIGEASDDPETVKRFAGRIQYESERLSRLVVELIELSRLQGADPLPEPQIVPVDRVLAEVLDRTSTKAEARHITISSGGESGLAVAGSEQQLVSAVLNLVENAITYSPPHSEITIATRSNQGKVEMAITDHGIGIGERDIGRIFERFYRADQARSRATGGTGLGLSIVKHIATNHGGTIDVWSVLGSGSVFTLRLPAVAPPSTSWDVMKSRTKEAGA
ncbi:MAG: two-component sensor histidine kinase [Corynebacteriales bacterium]|nr:two-component sensor histidine kinase [Mycobacteriales bacterium]